MQVINLKTGLEAPVPSQTFLCLGNFDGVHLGHQALIRAALTMRGQVLPQAALGVFCFRGLSSDYLASTPPGHLASEEERLSLFASVGAEYALIADFPAIRDTLPEQFIREILIRDCHCAAVACGFNHRFGRQGRGTPELLRTVFGERLLLQEAVLEGGEPISSTRIRGLLLAGKPEQAAALLGRPYLLTAPVMHGAMLGRTLGFPTVNQQFPSLALIPRVGVYATVCAVEGQRVWGVTDIGTRPTVNGASEVRCETHLLDYTGDLYGKRVQVAFLQYLRPEQRFASLEALRAQIEQDRERVQHLRRLRENGGV